MEWDGSWVVRSRWSSVFVFRKTGVGGLEEKKEMKRSGDGDGDGK